MRGRKDGRELFEVFRETMQKPSSPVEMKSQGTLGKEVITEEYEPVHAIKLGDRRQIEVAISNSWAYGLSIFLVLLLAGAFVMGRQFAVVPEPAPAIDAPPALLNEAQGVGKVTGPNVSAALDQQQMPPAVDPGGGGVLLEAPAPPAPKPVTGQGGNFVCVVTYPSPDSNDTKQKVTEVANLLKQRGLPDVRTFVRKDGKFRVVAVGSFITTTTVEAKETLAAVRATEFKGKKFSDAYFQNVRDFL